MTKGFPDFRVRPIDDGAQLLVEAISPRGRYAAYRLKCELPEVLTGSGLHDFVCRPGHLAEVRQGVEQEDYRFIDGTPVLSDSVPAWVPWFPPELAEVHVPWAGAVPARPPLYPSWDALFAALAQGRSARDLATLALARSLLLHSNRVRAVLVQAGRRPLHRGVIEMIRQCVAAVNGRNDAAVTAVPGTPPNPSKSPPGEVEMLLDYYGLTKKPDDRPGQGSLFDREDD